MNKFIQFIKDQIKALNFRVSAQEQLIFIKNLSVMIKAGLPMLESMKMLQKEARSRALRKILDSVIKDISNGQALSVSLAKYQNVFGDFFINIIEIGESAGILSENLNYLAEELKKKRELKQKVVGALIYPAVILTATFGITGLLTVFIFPKILPVFKTLNVKLPLSTKILIYISNILTEHGLAAVLILLMTLIIFWLVIKIGTVRYWYHQILIRLPIFGKMVRDTNLINLSRTLGITLKSGVKIVEAISITANSIQNLVYKKEFLNIAENIRKGQTIAEYLQPHPKLFPPTLAQMVAVGETTGNLSETLLYMSEFYETELTEMTKNLSNILEPFLMIFMGLIVGFVAISIITPIYEVTSTVGR